MNVPSLSQIAALVPGEKPSTGEAMGTFIGTVCAFAPWVHLLADAGKGTADAWVDRGLVVMSFLGLLILVNRFAPEVFPKIIILVAAIRSGRVDRTGEHKARDK